MKHIKRLHPETGADNAASSVAAAAAAAGIISPGGSGQQQARNKSVGVERVRLSPTVQCVPDRRSIVLSDKLTIYNRDDLISGTQRTVCLVWEPILGAGV